MNWENLLKYLYKGFLICYLVLWSLEVQTNKEKYTNMMKDSMVMIQRVCLKMEPELNILG